MNRPLIFQGLSFVVFSRLVRAGPEMTIEFSDCGFLSNVKVDLFVLLISSPIPFGESEV